MTCTPTPAVVAIRPLSGGDVFGTGRATIAEKHGLFVVRHTGRVEKADEEDVETAP